jgi:hypothetical protein
MEAYDHAVAVRQPLAHRGLNGSDSDATVPRNVVIESAGMSQKGVVLRQPVRFSSETADALQPGDELVLPFRFRAVHLHLGRSLRGEALDLLVDGLLDRSQLDARARGPHHGERARHFARPVERRDVGSDLVVVDQAPVQPRGETVCEHERGDVEVGFLAVEVGHRGPGDVDALLRDAIHHLDGFFALQHRDVAARAIERRPGRNAAEVPADQSAGLLGIEVPGDDQG